MGVSKMSKIVIFLDDCNADVVKRIIYYPEDKFKSNVYKLDATDNWSTGSSIKGVFSKSKLLVSRIKQAYNANYWHNKGEIK